MYHYMYHSSISQEKNILRTCPQVLLVLVSEHAWPTRLRGTRLASTGLKIWECWRCVDVVEIDYDGSAVSFDDTLFWLQWIIFVQVQQPNPFLSGGQYSVITSKFIHFTDFTKLSNFSIFVNFYFMCLLSVCTESVWQLTGRVDWGLWRGRQRQSDSWEQVNTGRRFPKSSCGSWPGKYYQVPRLTCSGDSQQLLIWRHLWRPWWSWNRVWRTGTGNSRYREFFMFLVVSEKNGTAKKYQNRYRKNLVPEKSLGTDICEIWYRKKVSEPVSEKIGTEKSTGIGIA